MQNSNDLQVLIIGTDTAAGGHAWPRYAPIARVLGTIASVRTIDPLQTDATDCPRLIAAALQHTDAAIIDGRILPWIKQPLKDSTVPVAIDLHDPLIDGAFVLPNGTDYSGDRETLIADQVTIGDFFICRNEAQRDYWLGVLTLYNCINPLTYAQDKSLSALIDVVPYGTDLAEDRPPDASSAVDAAEQDIVWLLDRHPWLDPVSLLHATDSLRRQIDHKVVFLIPPMMDSSTRGIVALAQRESARLGLTDRVVSFVECSSPAAVPRLLRAAAVAISLQSARFEARYAARPELPAYLQAGLPIIATPQNAEFVDRYGAGMLVRQGDAEDVALALYEVLQNRCARDEMRAAARHAAAALAWERACSTLLRWCRQPSKAPDARARLRSPRPGALPAVSPAALPALVLYYARTSGLSGLAQAARSYVTQRVSRRTRLQT